LEPITSRQNGHFKKLQDLHKREVRDSLGEFLVEGEKEISLAKEIDTLYYSEMTPFVNEMKKKSSLTIPMTKQLLENVSYRGDCIAVCKSKLSSWADIKNSSLVLLLEAIEKPGNLGGVLRTADAAGVEGIIIKDPVVDIFNPNVVRASLGAIFCLPIVQSSAKEALAFLEKNHFQIVVTTPSAKKFYHDVDYKKRTCIVVGSESMGLTPLWLENKNCTPVKIPMKGHVDSLNASISASVVMYEAIRQRNLVS